ncbi:MAG TPA: hypothetical protein VMV08_06375 [Gaiellaceae bacterium]|nr:hypothetical protein [Gaiellaceae bacterium]
MNGQAIVHDLRAGVELEHESEETIDVYCWRMEQLLRAGYARVLADALALDPRVDLHTACDLLAHGCPQGLAFGIVS